MRVDPGQLLLQRFGRETAAAEHSEPARPANRRNHVAAVAEGKEGEFRADHLAKNVGHD
jgi:hypothetical protein